MTIDRTKLDAILQQYADALRAADGDEEAERAASEAAVAAYRNIDDDPDALIAEILRDGDGDLLGAFDRADADDDEYERWGDLLADAADY